MLAAALFLVAASIGLGAQLGWYAALAVARLRSRQDQRLLDRATAESCHAIDQVAWQAQQTMQRLAVEGLARRQW